MRASLILTAAVSALACAPEATPNSAPEATLSADTTELAIAGTTALRVNALDPDGDPLSIAWSADGGFVVIPDFDPSGATLIAPDSAGATGRVLVTVSDDRGASTEATLEVSTSANQAPRIDSLDLTPDAPLDPLGEATLEARASDPEGLPLVLTWSADPPWSITPEEDDPRRATLRAPDAFGATARVRLVVEDSAGDRASTELEVRTRANAPPRISDLSVDGGAAQLEPASEFTLTLTSEDPDGHALSVSWSVDDPRWTVLSEDASRARLRAPDLYGAEVSVSARVSDGFGGSDEATLTLSTTSPTGPVITAFRAEPATVTRGDTLTLSVDATDPDGEPMRYFYRGPFDWTITSEGGPTATLTAPDAPDQRATIEVTVLDAENLSARASVSVSTLPNQAPVIERLSVAPDPVSAMGTATLTAVATDPDGDPLTARWSVSPTSWVLFDTGTEGASLLAPSDLSESATVTVTVTDDAGSSAQASVEVHTADTCPEDSADAGGRCATCDQAVIIRDHPIVQYRLNEVEGVAVDASGHRRDAAFGPAVLRGVGSPIHGEHAAAAFDGSDDAWLQFTPFTGFPADALSLELWLRTSERDPARAALSYVTEARRELVLADPTALTLTIAGETWATGLDVADGRWHLVVFTWRSVDGVVQAYLDGAPSGSTTLTPGALVGSGGALVLGADQGATPGVIDTGSAWRGALDEVSIYKDVLTSAENAEHLAALTCNERCGGGDDDGDGRVDEGWLGSAEACPATDCDAILDADAAVGDGDYWLLGAGGTPELAPCAY